MECADSLPYSQDPAIWPCPETEESSLRLQRTSLVTILILSSHLCPCLQTEILHSGFVSVCFSLITHSCYVLPHFQAEGQMPSKITFLSGHNSLLIKLNRLRLCKRPSFYKVLRKEQLVSIFGVFCTCHFMVMVPVPLDLLLYFTSEVHGCCFPHVIHDDLLVIVWLIIVWISVFT